jgi:hypothetical protein
MPRLIAITTVVAVAALIGLDATVVTLQPARVVGVYTVFMRLSLYLTAMGVAATAARRFHGLAEPLGRAWTFFAIQFGLLALNYALRRFENVSRLALDGSLVALNVFQVYAFWTMARILDTAGLGQLVGRTARTVWAVGAIGVAAVLCWSSISDYARAAVSGTVRPAALVSLASDIVTFALIAPVALTAIVLRGGRIAWTFLFLTISIVGWMVNGSAEQVAELIGGGPELLRLVRMAGVEIAALFNVAAALSYVIPNRGATSEP